MIKNTKAGRVSLLALMASMGYVGAANAQSLDYSAMEAIFGEPVTAAATGKPQRASEAPASITIISGDELRRSGVTTIPDVLQNYAGVDVNRYATMQREVTVRGGNMPYSPRLLVLVNGRQVFLDHYGYTDWALIGVEFDEIQQVELVRGPNSALFGFNAVAGVVNIVTKDMYGKSGLAVRLQGGSHDTRIASLVGTMQVNNRLAVRVSAGYEETDEWESFGAGDQARRRNIATEVAYKINDKVQTNLSYNYSDSDMLQQAYVYGLSDFQANLQSVNGVVTAQSDIGLLRGQVYYNWFDQEQPGLNVHNDVITAKLEDIFKLGTDHTFRIATEFRRSEYTFNNVQNGEVFFNVYALSGMWEWAVLNNLTLTNAVRVDRMDIGHDENFATFSVLTQDDYDVSHTIPSFNSSALWKINDKTRARISAARGVQVPSLNALGIAINIPGFNVTGDPTLEPSITNTYEIFLGRTVDAINGFASITGAFTDVRDYLAASQNSTIAVGGGGLIATEAKLGDFSSFSVETAVNGKFNEELGWEFNYTWTSLDQNLLTPAVDQLIPLEDGTPTHKVNVKLDWQRDGWQAYIAGRYRSETLQRQPGGGFGAPGTYSQRDGHITLDTLIGYDWENGVRVFAAIDNLTDNKASGMSPFASERRLRVGLAVRH